MEEHRMLRSQTIPARLGRIGLAAVVAAAGSLTLFQGVSNAAPLTYTASPATGPAGNLGYVLTLAGTGFADAAGTSQVNTAGVQFSATCGLTQPATSGTVFAATRFNVVSATRLAVTTPSLALGTGVTSLAWKICVYDLAGSHNLLGSATYTIYAAPAIGLPVKPASGPAFGGNTIAITGTGFTTKSTVKVDGVSATNVKIIGTTNITATVPAHAASSTAAVVVVTTEGGPNTAPSAGDDNYTYKSAVQVSPTFGPVGTVIDVKGVGFNSLNWSVAKVLFASGAYNPAQVGTTGVKTNPEAGVCGSVQVISDTELVCVVPNIGGALGAAYTVTLATSGAIDADTLQTGYFQSVVSSGATYTVSPF
jgi:hypothetical protein